MERIGYTILLVLPILLISACSSGSKEKEAIQTDEISTIEVATSIQLENLNGGEINLEEYKGKVIFLNFWATWCKPCISEMPAIDRLSKELGDEYVFLAASDENIDRIKKFANKYPHEFEYVHLKTNVYQLGLSVLPTTFIFNKEGEIVEKAIGAKEWDSPENLKKLRSI